MTWEDIDVPLRPWSEEDLHAAVEAAPPALCGPGAELAALEALAPQPSFAALLQALYPTHAGNLAAAGRLAERLASPRSWQVEGGTVELDQSVYPPLGHVGVVGDLEVRGDLTVIAALVVTGDLTVQGTLADCGPESRIVVLGRLRAGHIQTSGWVTVVGDVEVRGVLAGKYNDDAFESHGAVKADLILSDDHAFEAEGGLLPAKRPPSEGSWGEDVFDLQDPEHLEALRDLLGEAIDEDGEIVWDALPAQPGA